MLMPWCRLRRFLHVHPTSHTDCLQNLIQFHHKHKTLSCRQPHLHSHCRRHTYQHKHRINKRWQTMMFCPNFATWKRIRVFSRTRQSWHTQGYQPVLQNSADREHPLFWGLTVIVLSRKSFVTMYGLNHVDVKNKTFCSGHILYGVMPGLHTKI